MTRIEIDESGGYIQVDHDASGQEIKLHTAWGGYCTDLVLSHELASRVANMITGGRLAKLVAAARNVSASPSLEAVDEIMGAELEALEEALRAFPTGGLP